MIARWICRVWGHKPINYWHLADKLMISEFDCARCGKHISLEHAYDGTDAPQ